MELSSAPPTPRHISWYTETHIIITDVSAQHAIVVIHTHRTTAGVCVEPSSHTQWARSTLITASIFRTSAMTHNITVTMSEYRIVALRSLEHWTCVQDTDEEGPRGARAANPVTAPAQTYAGVAATMPQFEFLDPI